VKRRRRCGGIPALARNGSAPARERAMPDADALARIGIDLDEVRRRVEESFGPGALERTRAMRRLAS
jgi:hypothetical protein